MTSLHVVPSEKDSNEAKRDAVTATLRVWPALAEEMRRLALSHDFGPTQAAQWLASIGVDMRAVLGDRWHVIASLADRAKVTPGVFLGRLVVQALEAGLAEDGPHGVPHRRSK